MKAALTSFKRITEKFLRTLTFGGGVGDGEKYVCLMSARSLLDGRGLTDAHPSGVIRALGIAINDGGWWDSDAERTETLLPVALDKRLCRASVVVTPELERRRAFRCADFACREMAPFALEAAGLKSEAEKLRALAPVVDEASARSAESAARSAAESAAWSAARSAAWSAESAASARPREACIALLLELCEMGVEK